MFATLANSRFADALYCLEKLLMTDALRVKLYTGIKTAKV